VARAGEFIQPAMSAEAMYDPAINARSGVARVTIVR
jgi:uncharacterized protein YfaS (alpha-2-macroglobulin family)